MPPTITLTLLVWVPILFVCLLLASGWLVASGKRGMRRELARVRAVRRDGSVATFVADFPPDQAAPDILHAVYRTFQRAMASHQGVEGFVVRADDELATVYDAHVVDDYNDLNDLDLRGLVAEAAAACGRRLPEAAEVRVRVNLETVRDVVLFLERCPQVSDSGPQHGAAKG